MSLENYIKAVHEIDQRLIYHSVEGSGRILDGVLYDRAQVVKALGVSQLPYVQPLDWGDEEESGVAGGSVWDGCDENANVAYKHTMSLTYLVGARKEWGWFAQDNSNVGLDASAAIDPKYIEGGLGIMQVVARVKDAIETTRDGLDAYDGSLGGLLFKPLRIAARENFLTDTSQGCLLEVQLEMEAECRGKRSLNSGLPQNFGSDGEGGYVTFGTGSLVEFPALSPASSVTRLTLDVHLTSELVIGSTKSPVFELTPDAVDKAEFYVGEGGGSFTGDILTFANDVAGGETLMYGGKSIEAGFHQITYLWDATNSRYRLTIDGREEGLVGGSLDHPIMGVEKIRLGRNSALEEPDFGFVRLRIWDDSGPLVDITPPTVGADVNDASLWTDSVSSTTADTATSLSQGSA